MIDAKQPKRMGRPPGPALPAEDRPDLLAGVPEPTAEAVRAARGSLSQAAAAQLMGLSDAQALSKIERGQKGTDKVRLALLLLATGQHPAFVVTQRETGLALY